MRLQKYLALCGVASRRHCEELIAKGLVQVNGITVTVMGVQVADTDVVAVSGKAVVPEGEKRYVLYYKPVGEVTTVTDPEGRPTVMDHFRGDSVRLYPVGRLDFDSEGLLLLTNDGDLAARLTHPSHEVDKVYLARVTGMIPAAAIHVLRSGVMLDGQITSPAAVRIIRSEAFATVLQVSIHEGRNRQVRRMIEAVGHKVLMLRRIQYGPLELGALERGQWRDLTADEVEKLKAL
jgi:23S rRNA pseudouridine2605 synthase